MKMLISISQMIQKKQAPHDRAGAQRHGRTALQERRMLVVLQRHDKRLLAYIGAEQRETIHSAMTLRFTVDFSQASTPALAHPVGSTPPNFSGLGGRVGLNSAFLKHIETLINS